MKRILFKLGYLACSLAMFVAVNSLNNICVWKSYQPVVPKELLDMEID